MSLAAVVAGAGLHAPPALAAPAPAQGLPPIPIPGLVTQPWDGRTGVVTSNERWVTSINDLAELTEEPEVRDAALAVLATGDAATIRTWALTQMPVIELQVQDRKAREAAERLAKVKTMVGTGVRDGYFNAEVTRVLAGSDDDRRRFLAYGADIERERDKKKSGDVVARAAQLRERLRVFATAAPAGSQVRLAAERALAGNDTAVEAFFTTGYAVAANADAQARELHLKDLEERNAAAEALSDLAQRAKRASEARTQMMVAHGNGVRALQRAANAMGGAANAARHSQRVLAGNGTVASKNGDLNIDKSQIANDLEDVKQAAAQAQSAAVSSRGAAQVLQETGLTYGVEWSDMAEGLSQAAAAAVGATTTAGHAVDATIATNNAQGAQAKAEAHEQQAITWHLHAEEHAKAAAKLAAAAQKQATAAKTAAARAKTAREQAQAAEKKAWAGAERTRAQRQTAEAQAEEAKRQRQIAEAQRAEAERQRGIAQQQASVASSQRAAAEAQAATARAARQRADAADQAAGSAANRAWDQEGRARIGRDEAFAAERAEQTANARAAAMRSSVASAGTEAERQEAQRQADQAGVEASAASTAARSARSSANQASGAAANARAAANRAQQAAEQAFAAAEAAEAAAAAADAAADKAEASAQQTHAARMRADARAAEATAQEVKAAHAAQSAVSLAEQAADEAVQSLWAANRTKDEAEAATTEAVAAAAQADIAVNAAIAAQQSAAGIAEPANTAIGMVGPFTGADIDADFVKLVAEQAASIGAEQAAAAAQRANEAVTAAEKADKAAQQANEHIPGAFTAAAQAARSAAAAAASAAEAKASAAQAAADGAAARIAAASARHADAQARADAFAARKAANEAANDAAIAGQAAQAAQTAAQAAATAATAAEKDATAAQGAASRAEADAAAAEEAASSAQEYATSALLAANNAVQFAAEAQQAAIRAEEADRKRAAEALANGIADTGGLPDGETEKALLESLTPQERAEYLAAKEQAGKGLLDFLRENAGELLEELTGLGDLKKCVSEGNVEACLWTLVNMLPIGKIFGATAKLAKLTPKLLAFLDGLKAARKKVEDLVSSIRRRNGCPVLHAPPPNSFVPGTPVLLADRSSKPIEDIRIGDLVVATDPVTGVTRPEQVTETITRTGDKVLVDLSVDTDGAAGDDSTTITATDNHPFWAPNLAEWLDAGDIIPGVLLLTASGQRVKVETVQTRQQWATVHNLTVANLHTYYVAPEGLALLVHNVTPIPCGIAPTFPGGATIPVRKAASVGNAAGKHNYRNNFFAQNPTTRGKVVVHHAIEKNIGKKYPGLFTMDELHSVENLRGVPKGEINSNIHLSKIRLAWNDFYTSHPNPTKQEVLDYATKVDDLLGHWFEPRVR